MKKIKLLIAKCLLRIAEGKLVKADSQKADSQIRRCADSQMRKFADSQKADSQMRKFADSPNTLTTFPHYLKKPIRFWSTNVGDEIRSSFDVELYCKVCEARGLSSGVEIIY
jgi:hypothetical protein